MEFSVTFKNLNYNTDYPEITGNFTHIFPSFFISLYNYKWVTFFIIKRTLLNMIL